MYSISRFQVSVRRFSFVLIACLAGFTCGLQAQSAHFSGPARIPGSIANAEAGGASDVRGTNGVFGPVNVGASSANPVALVFTFDTGVTLGSTAVLTQGAANLDFTDAGGGTCTPDKAYSAGDTCTVKVTFKPRAPGPRYGAAELLDTSGDLLANGFVQGTGVGPLVTFANTTSGDYLSSEQSILGSWSTEGPNCVAVDASGNIFITPGGQSAVSEIVAVNGSIPASPTIKTLGSGFNWPYGVTVDGAGNVFVGDRGNDAVKEIVAAGGYTTVKTLGGGFGFGGPNGVAVDGSGNVFVADWGKNAVDEIVAAGGYTTVKTLASGFDVLVADGVAVDGAGNVFVAAYDRGVIEIVAAGGYTTVKMPVDYLSGNTDVAVDASGNLFVTNWWSGIASGIAYEILAAGRYNTFKTLATGFGLPLGLTRDGSGNVYVADQGNRRLVELNYADPPSLAFANTSVGAKSSDSPQTVTVSNNGNADLTFPVPASGNNPSISSGFTLAASTTCPQLDPSSKAGTLAAGTSCVYVVDFIPVARGTDSGSLTLTDNSLNASPAVMQAISLSGQGIAPHLVFTTPPPANLRAGVTPGIVKVSVEDSSNKVVTTSSATVTLTVTGPSKYSKAYTATAASGIATFGSLASLITAGSFSYTATDVPDDMTQAVALESVTWPPPIGGLDHAVDSVTLSTTVGQSDSVRVSGWAADLADGAPLSNVMVYIDGTSIGTPTLGIARPDVAAAYKDDAYFDSGYKLLYPASSLSLGTHQVKVVAIDSGGRSTTFGPRTITVAAIAGAGSPFGGVEYAVDSVTFSTTVGQADSVKIEGWTADPQDGAPLSNVKVYIDGTSIGTPTLDIARPDVVATYGNNAYLDSGYKLLYPASSLSLGTHRVTVVAIDSGGRSTTFGPRTITVAATAGAGSPFGAIDHAVDSVTGSTTVGQADSVKIQGWTADPQDGAPLSNVKVYIDGTSIGTPTLGIARPDVVAAYGNNAYLDCGYKLLYPASSLSLGTHQVTVVAIDSGGRSTTLGPRVITVQ